MYIYRLLIMFAHSMGWALVWATGGPRPLLSTIGSSLDIKGGLGFTEYLKVVGINRLLPLAACAAIAHMLS